MDRDIKRFGIFMLGVGIFILLLVLVLRDIRPANAQNSYSTKSSVRNGSSGSDLALKEREVQALERIANCACAK